MPTLPKSCDNGDCYIAGCGNVVGAFSRQLITRSLCALVGALVLLHQPTWYLPKGAPGASTRVLTTTLRLLSHSSPCHEAVEDMVSALPPLSLLYLT